MDGRLLRRKKNVRQESGKRQTVVMSEERMREERERWRMMEESELFTFKKKVYAYKEFVLPYLCRN